MGQAVEEALEQLADDLREAVADERSALTGAVETLYDRTEQLAGTLAKLAETQAERNGDVAQTLETIIEWLEIAAAKVDRLERLRLPLWRRLWDAIHSVLFDTPPVRL